MNRETAITQAGLNNYNQVTPWGNLTYTQIGTWEDGTPRFQATTTLSPEQQQLYNLNTQTQQTLGQIGVEQSDKIRNLLNTPVDLSNEAVEGRLFELGSKRLDPVFAQRETSLRSELLNRGIREGTPAFEAEMRMFSEGKNDAFNNLLLQGRGQSIQELLTSRNQPINEITALMSGSQVQAPNFVNTPQTPVSGVDYAGMVNDNYARESANYQSMMGGLFGLGGQMVGGWARAGFPMPSDRRLKEDARVVGEMENGLPVYLFRYRGSPAWIMGVMADDVRMVKPEAVVNIDGYDHVRYDLL